ncbi:hypothetical protein [Nocardia sp. R6R-6]|uniref:hypothetical protein n=1 Tax=Nocardia sp. R6R-6 TaxID=3459303 RepID=UPI00403E1336
MTVDPTTRLRVIHERSLPAFATHALAGAPADRPPREHLRTPGNPIALARTIAGKDPR